MSQDLLRTAIATVHGASYELAIRGDSFDFYGSYDKAVAYYHGKAVENWQGLGPIEDRVMVVMVQEDQEQFRELWEDLLCHDEDEDGVFVAFYLRFSSDRIWDPGTGEDNWDGTWFGEPLTDHDLQDPQFEGITYV